MKIEKEKSPVWDERKRQLFIEQNKDVFNIKEMPLGEEILGDWFHLEENNEIIGYGYINTEDLENEVQIVIDKKCICSNKKYGSSILRFLEKEIIKIGQLQITGIVKHTNPNKFEILKWLCLKNGFRFNEFHKTNYEEILEYCRGENDVFVIKILNSSNCN